MKDKHYKVFRDKLYIGRIVVTDKVRPVYDFNDHGIKEKEIKEDSHLIAPSYYPYRTIFFTLDENNLANDLLYNSPAYPILNMTDNSYFEKHKDETITLVDDVVAIGPILKYFHYGLVLRYEDILYIKKVFFSGNYFKTYSELFGYQKVTKENEETFTYVGNETFPHEYFATISKLENHSLKDVLSGDYSKMNSFRPPLNEHKVRRLKK